MEAVAKHSSTRRSAGKRSRKARVGGILPTRAPADKMAHWNCSASQSTTSTERAGALHRARGKTPTNRASAEHITVATPSLLRHNAERPSNIEQEHAIKLTDHDEIGTTQERCAGFFAVITHSSARMLHARHLQGSTNATC